VQGLQLLQGGRRLGHADGAAQRRVQERCTWHPQPPPSHSCTPTHPPNPSRLLERNKRSSAADPTPLAKPAAQPLPRASPGRTRQHQQAAAARRRTCWCRPGRCAASAARRTPRAAAGCPARGRRSAAPAPGGPAASTRSPAPAGGGGGSGPWRPAWRPAWVGAKARARPRRLQLGPAATPARRPDALPLLAPPGSPAAPAAPAPWPARPAWRAPARRAVGSTRRPAPGSCAATGWRRWPGRAAVGWGVLRAGLSGGGGACVCEGCRREQHGRHVGELERRHAGRAAGKAGMCPSLAGRVRSGQVGSDRIRSGRIRLGQVGSGQVRSGQVRSGQVRSGRVGSGRVGSGQVRSGRGRRRQAAGCTCDALKQ
jgi:hypothetical protein